MVDTTTGFFSQLAADVGALCAERVPSGFQTGVNATISVALRSIALVVMVAGAAMLFTGIGLTVRDCEKIS